MGLADEVQPFLRMIPERLFQQALTPHDVNSNTRLNYDVLEWTGDIYVKVAATELLERAKDMPLPMKNLTRDILVSGAYLARISDELGLDLRVQPAGQSCRVRSIKEDVLEAVIGAIAQSQSRDAAVAFATICITPLLDDAITLAKKNQIALRHNDRKIAEERRQDLVTSIEGRLREREPTIASASDQEEAKRVAELKPAAARAYVTQTCSDKGLEMRFKKLRWVGRPTNEKTKRESVQGLFVDGVLVGEGSGTCYSAQALACVDAVARKELPWLSSKEGSDTRSRAGSVKGETDHDAGSESGSISLSPRKRDRSEVEECVCVHSGNCCLARRGIAPRLIKRQRPLEDHKRDRFGSDETAT